MLHEWDLSPREAIELQRELAKQITCSDRLPEVKRIAGVDVAYNPRSGQSAATVCVLDFPSLELLECSVAHCPTPFPYVPGLLSFREVPPILKAFESLKTLPELIFVDGHGRAHPRRIGIASHLGLWLRLPTIGIGKSRLCGTFEEPGMTKGSWTDLVHRDEVVGLVLRSRTNVKPIFVSVGYGIPLDECLQWTLQTTPKYRLPEPIRQADRIAGQSK